MDCILLHILSLAFTHLLLFVPKKPDVFVGEKSHLDVWCCSFDFQRLVISLLSVVSFNLLSGVKLKFDYL